MVMLAATRRRESRRTRSACAPASKAAAASTMRRAQSVTSAPASVRREPRGERSTRATPNCRSMERIRLLAAGWVIPSSRAAPPRLPSRATASSSSSAPRSGTRWDSPPPPAVPRSSTPLIKTAYALIEPYSLVPALSPRECGVMVTAVRHLGPNWYAAVMGTAIVATAGNSLPVHLPGLRTICAAVWLLSLLLLVTLLCARALHWRHHADQARAHLLDPTVAPFYGCLAMALLAVGGGALTVGRYWIGTGAAVALDTVLFTGTVVGLAAAVAVPYLMATGHKAQAQHATPVWLLPLVAPMVSAALGPLLVPHL